LTYARSITDESAATQLRLQSVAHLCRASDYSKAYREVLLPLVLRGDASYSIRHLGLLEGTLSALKKFFQPVTWERPQGTGAYLSTSELANLRRLAVALLTAVEGYSAPDLGTLLDLAEREAIDTHARDETFYFHYGRWRYFSGKAQLDSALTVATELRRMARDGDSREQWVGIRTLVTTQYRQGRLDDAEALSGRAIVAGDTEGESGNWLLADSPICNCLLIFALCTWHKGRGNAATQLIQRGLSRVKEGEPHVRMVADYLAAYLSDFQHDYRASRAYADEMVELSGALGFRWWYVVGVLRQGWVEGCERDARAGIRTLQKGLLMWNDTGARVGVPYWKSLLADLQLKAGDADAAALSASEAAEAVRQTGERWWEPEVHRTLGRAEERRGSLEAALASYQAALQAAISIGSLTLELRARVSLGRLAADVGRRDLVIDALGSVSGSAEDGLPEQRDFDAARRQHAVGVTNDDAGAKALSATVRSS
jgi:tetratricopeptide (TPR) repeat protein